MSSATSTNGKPQRKQLSEQLDRFDAMLDGLSDGLSDAVADAARAGTRLAVKDAIVEILTDPQLRNQLHQATAPAPEPTEPKMGFWGRIKAGVRRIGGAAQDCTRGVTRFVGGIADSVGGALRDPLQTVRMLGSFRRLLVLGSSVGAAVAILSYLCPHVLSAAVSGLGAAATAMAVQVGLWARRTFRVFSVV